LDDLNDYHCSVQVVAHGGFAAASRVLVIPKSKLSRRGAALEQRLGADRPLRSAVHAGPRWVKLRRRRLVWMGPVDLRKRTCLIALGAKIRSE
jgi:DNA-binding transcriptional LysR family regulator